MNIPLKAWFSAGAGLLVLALGFMRGKRSAELKTLRQQQKANALKTASRLEREATAKKIDDERGQKSASVNSHNVGDALNELFNPKN